MQLVEIWSLLKRYNRISQLEMKAQYSGTMGGVLWMPVSSLLFSVGLCLIFLPKETFIDSLLYIGSGFSIWQLISVSLARSTTLLTDGKNAALSLGMRFSDFFVKDMFINFKTYLYYISPIICIYILFAQGSIFHIFVWVVPTTLIVIMVLLPVRFIVAIISLFYRDFAHLLPFLIRIMFFLTPVFWYIEVMPDQIVNGAAKVREIFFYFNPFQYLLSAVRFAFELNPNPLMTFGVLTVIFLFSIMLAFVLYKRYNHYIWNIQ